MFRRLEPGINPELEMLRFLRTHGFTDAPELMGWIELRSEHSMQRSRVAQGFVADGRDAWELTLDALEQDDGRAEDAAQLGAVVGSMHGVLGSDTRHPAFAPEQPSAEWMALLAVDIDRHIEDLFASLPSCLRSSPLAGRGEEVRAVLEPVTRQDGGGRLIRTHGDLHLGQVLRRPHGWCDPRLRGRTRPIPGRPAS